jgi:predicted enzyme related to lactoylglutathione lyase
MIKQVKLVSIPVVDQARALEFYTKKLGFSVFTDRPFTPEQRWIELRVASSQTGVVLFTPDEHKSWIGQFMNITFTCDDVDETYRELCARGVEFTGPPAKQPWGTYALFKDPDGNTFCLSSR